MLSVAAVQRCQVINQERLIIYQPYVDGLRVQREAGLETTNEGVDWLPVVGQETVILSEPNGLLFVMFQLELAAPREIAPV